jgi:hypothetical protein
MPGILEEERQEISRHVSCERIAGYTRDVTKSTKKTSVACGTDPEVGFTSAITSLGKTFARMLLISRVEYGVVMAHNIIIFILL